VKFGQPRVSAHKFLKCEPDFVPGSPWSEQSGGGFPWPRVSNSLAKQKRKSSRRDQILLMNDCLTNSWTAYIVSSIGKHCFGANTYLVSL
jgi:hypothetical protein